FGSWWVSCGDVSRRQTNAAIRDGIRVVTGDTRAVTAAKVFDPRQVTLAGGGGTDMGVLIRQVAEAKPVPQLIVVCTDGDTPWCEPIGIPVVACVTQETYAKRVPTWIKTVALSN